MRSGGLRTLRPGRAIWSAGIGLLAAAVYRESHRGPTTVALSGRTSPNRFSAQASMYTRPKRRTATTLEKDGRNKADRM